MDLSTPVVILNADLSTAIAGLNDAIRSLSTPAAVLIGAAMICVCLRGWEKRLSKQLLWLLQPEKAAQWAQEDRDLKAYLRRNLILGIFPRRRH